MTAPTEQEIRAEVLEDGMEWPKVGGTYATRIRDVIQDWAAPLWSAAFHALESPDERSADDGSATALWTDLRPSEAVELKAAVMAAIGRAADRCAAIVVDELTSAGVEFAQRYPDAPRAKVAEAIA
jgi:hypothetical protein